MLTENGAVETTIGAVTAPGLRRRITVETAGGNKAERETVLVKRGRFPALAQGAAITVDSESWEVAEFWHEDPGLVRVLLTAP